MQSAFQFAWNSFLNRAASEQCCPSVRTIALQLHAIFILKLEHPDYGDWHSDGWTLYVWLALSRIASGREHTSSGRLQLSFISVFWNEIIFFVEHWKRPAVLLRRLDRCNLEQFEASQHRGRSGQKVLVVRTDDTLTVERPNGISRRSDGCKGCNCSYLESVQNLLET